MPAQWTDFIHRNHIDIVTRKSEAVKFPNERVKLVSRLDGGNTFLVALYFQQREKIPHVFSSIVLIKDRRDALFWFKKNTIYKSN